MSGTGTYITRLTSRATLASGRFKAIEKETFSGPTC